MGGETEINIVESGAADAPVIAELVRQLADEEGEASPVTAGYARTYLASPGCHVLLATLRQRTVGLASYSLRPGLFHAAPSCVIEALVAEVLKRAREAKCAEVSVTAAKDNTRAQALYRRLGLTDESLFLEMHFG